MPLPKKLAAYRADSVASVDRPKERVAPAGTDLQVVPNRTPCRFLQARHVAASMDKPKRAGREGFPCLTEPNRHIGIPDQFLRSVKADSQSVPTRRNRAVARFDKTGPFFPAIKHNRRVRKRQRMYPGMLPPYA